MSGAFEDDEMSTFMSFRFNNALVAHVREMQEHPEEHLAETKSSPSTEAQIIKSKAEPCSETGVDFRGWHYSKV